MPKNKKSSNEENGQDRSDVWNGPLDSRDGFYSPLQSDRPLSLPRPHHHGPKHRGYSEAPHHRHPGPLHRPHPRAPHHQLAIGAYVDHGLFDSSVTGQKFAELASERLRQILPVSVVRWLFRAASFGPPEMMAIFKTQLATLENLVSEVEASGKQLTVFSPNDLQCGEKTMQAMSGLLSNTETEHCLNSLFVGPEEVQAIAFVSLVTLRLQFSLADQAVEVESP